MTKQLRVSVNGNPYVVEIMDVNANPVEVTVNGKSYSVEFEEAPVLSRPAVESAPAVAPIQVAPKPVTKPAAAPVAAGNGDVVIAPMPGTIVEINVKPGDKVAYGDALCSLEAMKMKNIIRANHECTIVSVEVVEGQKVPYGAVLIRLA